MKKITVLFCNFWYMIMYNLIIQLKLLILKLQKILNFKIYNLTIKFKLICNPEKLKSFL